MILVMYIFSFNLIYILKYLYNPRSTRHLAFIIVLNFFPGRKKNSPISVSRLYWVEFSWLFKRGKKKSLV